MLLDDEFWGFGRYRDAVVAIGDGGGFRGRPGSIRRARPGRSLTTIAARHDGAADIDKPIVTRRDA